MGWSDNKLTLHEKMGGTWLIQRLEKPYNLKHVNLPIKDNPFSFGGGLKNGGLSDSAMDLIREIWSFDYMGAAEFEFGAVPAALRFIAEQASKNNLLHSGFELHKGEMVYLIAPLEYFKEASNRIKLLREDPYKLGLKERCGLDSYFDEKEERYKVYAKKTCGWLEIDNGFMFFTDKEMYDKTCVLFGLK
jgi:hypothetical protein